jgi:fructosamine-3-kinase
VIEREPLQGGLMSTVHRVRLDDGSTYIHKQTVDPPPGLFECEAEGLRTLSDVGAARTPRVIDFGEDFILLEDLGPQGEPPPGYWEEFGRMMARLHSVRSDRFGYHRDNYIGTKLLDNRWSDSGGKFFAETRVRRFLSEPLVDQTLTAEDRQTLERFIDKLPDRLPEQGPSLVHGDLWTGNMLIDPEGRPALIDPAVAYGLPEADLALLPDFEKVPEAFYAAYLEICPLEPGWRDRLYMLSIRDALGMVAEFGNRYGTLERVRAVLARFA